MSTFSYTGLIALSALLYVIAHTIYNLYLHPLSKFPGPFLHRASRLPHIYRNVSGTLTRDVLAFHERYGNVVRIAPNELAFSSAQAWKDIYGHRPGQEELPKARIFYRSPGVPPSLFAEDKENHAMLRGLLKGGFSERSMREQEPIIGGYVDLLVKRLREHCVDRDAKDKWTGLQGRNELDMTKWYTWTTFDIICDLAFGEPFGCLDRAGYHPWVAAVNQTFRAGAVMLGIKQLGLERIVLPIFRLLIKGRQVHRQQIQDKLQRRVELKTERHDLIAPLLTIHDKLGWERLRVNASLLVIAGSETTATLLSGTTYLLLSNPDALRQLTEEVRSAFKSDDEITLLSVGNLTYMLACLNEALRMYSPVAGGMPRSTPNGEAMVDGHLVPKDTILSVFQWATFHRSAYFKEPFAFRPERWMRDPRYAGDDLEVVRPFSVGSRDCIGKNLAYAEMRLILAKMVFNFDMELVDKDMDWLDHKSTTLWIKPPLNVYLTLRGV